MKENRINTLKKKRLRYRIISVCSFLTFLLVWYLATDVLKLAPAYSLPSPVTVAKTFFVKLTSKSPDGATIPQHVLSSLQVVAYGYILGAVIGVPLGIAMGWFKTVDRIVRPVFDFMKPVPPLALIPVMIVLFGISIKAKAVLIFFSTVVPCVLNSYSGIKQTKQIHLWVAETFGASNLQQLFTVAIPSAMPMIFAGLRVTMGSAWLALVAAELLAATRGLGYLISVARSLLRADLIIVGILCIGFCGTALTYLFDIIEKFAIRRGKDK